MSNDNTLQIYLDKIHFDRPTTMFMWAYVVTFVRANVDGDVQMYVSPASFRIRRIDSPGPDLVHDWDADGLLIASLPTENLESVSVTTFLIRDKRKMRKAGEFLTERFKDDKDGARIAKLLGDAISAIPGAGGVAASVVLKVAPAFATLIGKVLMQLEDKPRIYGDGTLRFDDADDFRDTIQRWSINRSDRGYFTTYWDFRKTTNPSSPVNTVTLPEWLRERLGV